MTNDEALQLYRLHLACQSQIKECHGDCTTCHFNYDSKAYMEALDYAFNKLIEEEEG